MREHLFPEQQLKALGEQLLLNPETDTRSPLPSVADRVVGVLIALMAQGITFELDLISLPTEVTTATPAYVERLLQLFDGDDPARHLWRGDELGHFELLSR
jgi:hypothetical protein